MAAPADATMGRGGAQPCGKGIEVFRELDNNVLCLGFYAAFARSIRKVCLKLQIKIYLLCVCPAHSGDPAWVGTGRTDSGDNWGGGDSGGV